MLTTTLQARCYSFLHVIEKKIEVSMKKLPQVKNGGSRIKPKQCELITSIPNLHVILTPNPCGWLIPHSEITVKKWGGEEQKLP